MQPPPSARVILLGGPSGAGKTRLADRTGLPIVRLDDFYREGTDPALPRSSSGLVDWDDVRAWNGEAAVAALDELCRTGAADLPVYEIAHDGVVGTQRVVLAGARLVVAEGIFAAEIIADARDRGLVAAALCVRQNRYLTWWRRLIRDIRERRKPVPVLIRRGLHLLRIEPEVVERHVRLGATCVSPAQGLDLIAGLR
jgi:uridine kinase